MPVEVLHDMCLDFLPYKFSYLNEDVALKILKTILGEKPNFKAIYGDGNMRRHFSFRAYIGQRRRYLRYRLRKVIREIKKKTDEFKLTISSSITFYDIILYVTKKGMFIQEIEFEQKSKPKPIENLDAAIEYIVEWIQKHTIFRPSERWKIKWEKWCSQ